MTFATEDRWEHGSFFDARRLPTASEPNALLRDAVLFGSGRGALLAALEHGRGRGWRRLVVPTYYCHDVTRFLEPFIEVRFYDHGPTAAATVVQLVPGEVALIVEYFGARATARAEGGDVLLDRTHDPVASWKYEQPPEMTFASLRKTLPLPDGGALWPANNEAVGDPSRSPELEDASAAMGRAMAMKAEYLDGGSQRKSTYLEAHTQAERALTLTGEGAMTSVSRELLGSMPIRDLRRRRQENRAAFKRAFGSESGVLRHHDFPAFIVLSAPSRATRDQVRAALMRRRIYSAVLWSLDDVEVAPEELDFSDRTLVLHADHRYTSDDMIKVAAEVGAVAKSGLTSAQS